MKLKNFDFLYFFFFLPFLLINCNVGQYAKYHKDIEEYQFNWDGYERSYYLYLPDAIDNEEAVSVLFVLHGGGGTAKGTPGLTFGRFNELADQHKFIVVYPQGVEKQWNDGRIGQQTKAWREDIDDAGFLVEVVNRLGQKYSINKNKVFTSGMSNGGFMSTRLLCDRPDVFRGGAILTATISKDYFPNCNPDRAVAVLVMNGTDDKLVPYNGGPIRVLGKERGETISTDDYIRFWKEKNECNQAIPKVDLPDKAKDGTTVSKLGFTNCKDNTSSVVLYKIKGGGHTWPGGKQYLGERLIGKTCRDINACDEIWEFFSSIE